MEVERRLRPEIENVEELEGVKIIKPKVIVSNLFNISFKHSELLRFLAQSTTTPNLEEVGNEKVVSQRQVFPDSRGYFSETYNAVEWKEQLGFEEKFLQVSFDTDEGLLEKETKKCSGVERAAGVRGEVPPVSILQDNTSFSHHGVTRGMHAQPGMGKLVSVSVGRIYDVIVDVRPGSRTFGKWKGFYLDAANKHALWVPDGFLHGFQVISEQGAYVSYKCSGVYDSSTEYGIDPFDADLSIEWPICDPAKCISKKTYVLNDDAFKTDDDSVVFEKTSGTTPKLISTSPLSPLMWRYIFTRSPAHPVDCEDGEQAVIRRTHTRASTTSSAGYGSQTSNDSIPRLGASSVCGESSQIEVFSSKVRGVESSPIPEVRTKSYWGTPTDSPVAGRYTLPAVTESSPIGEAPGIWGKPMFIPAADHETSLESSTVKRVEYVTLHAGKTPANMHNMEYTSSTLPPKTPYRFDVNRLEVRGRKIPSAPKDEVDSPVGWPDARDPHFHDELTPTVSYDVGTPATLPPKTPYRGEALRHEMRTRISMPAMEFLEEDEEECSSSRSDSSAVVGASIWGEPDYSPASSTELDTSHTRHSCTPYRPTFARHESRKISLRRMPSAPISGRVQQMVQFFENDSMRVEVPRRLDQAPPEFMRSCPQMDITPSPPRPVHGHTHSDRVRGVTSASGKRSAAYGATCTIVPQPHDDQWDKVL
uniref:Uncharacterized protein n=1 Tax=Pristionchus pacificus TaxID=54126 RepID=A0A2A6C5G2_PRIPA|eukprot:PDM73346.1 hypothetical protein PRIPAC_40702 [Pristionchus pacificus]